MRRTFNCADQAKGWEDTVIDRIGAVKSERWLNRSNRGSRFAPGPKTEEHKKKIAATMRRKGLKPQRPSLEAIARAHRTQRDNKQLRQLLIPIPPQKGIHELIVEAEEQRLKRLEAYARQRERMEVDNPMKTEKGREYARQRQQRCKRLGIGLYSPEAREKSKQLTRERNRAKREQTLNELVKIIHQSEARKVRDVISAVVHIGYSYWYAAHKENRRRVMETAGWSLVSGYWTHPEHREGNRVVEQAPYAKCMKTNSYCPET